MPRPQHRRGSVARSDSQGRQYARDTIRIARVRTRRKDRASRHRERRGSLLGARHSAEPRAAPRARSCTRPAFRNCSSSPRETARSRHSISFHGRCPLASHRSAPGRVPHATRRQTAPRARAATWPSSPSTSRPVTSSWRVRDRLPFAHVMTLDHDSAFVVSGAPGGRFRLHHIDPWTGQVSYSTPLDDAPLATQPPLVTEPTSSPSPRATVGHWYPRVPSLGRHARSGITRPALLSPTYGVAPPWTMRSS